MSGHRSSGSRMISTAARGYIGGCCNGQGKPEGATLYIVPEVSLIPTYSNTTTPAHAAFKKHNPSVVVPTGGIDGE